MIAPLLAWDGAGWSYGWDPVSALPRGRMAGHVYVLGHEAMSRLLPLLEPGDIAMGRHGEIAAYRLTDGTTLHRGSSLRLPDDPVAANAAFWRLHTAVLEAGLRWGYTGSSLARASLTAWGRVPTLESRALPPRWRGLAVVHQGPQVATMASLTDAWLVDQDAAYLRAATIPLPVAGSYRALTPVQAAKAWRRGNMSQHGLARVGVRAGMPVRHAVGPLPAKRYAAIGTVWPAGQYSTTVTLPWLHALDADVCAGASVQWTPLEVAECRAWPWLATWAEAVARVEYTPLRKLLYQCGFGAMAYHGGDTATVEPRSHMSGHRLGPWQHGPDPLDYGAPWYRPDVAAYIAATAAVDTLRTAGKLWRRGASVAAYLLDAVIASSDMEAPHWRLKARGNARVYGAGVYTIGDRIAASGWPAATEPTSDGVAEWVGRSRATANAYLAREWTGQPATDAAAVSYAPILDQPFAEWSHALHVGWDGTYPDPTHDGPRYASASLDRAGEWYNG